MSKRKCDGLAQLVSSYIDDEDSDQSSSVDGGEEEEKQISKRNEFRRDNGFESAKRVKKSPEEAVSKKEDVNLPLPKGILNMFNDKDTDDASSSCDGRVRTFEHFPGNWALHIFTPFPATRCLDPIIHSLVDSLPSGVAATMHMFPLSDLHVSLSRTVPIRHYWIEPIVEQLKDVVTLKQRFNCIIERPHLYVNDDKTRSFMGLKISTGEQQLKNLISLIDDILVGFALPKFYENPSFHVSVAWCLGDIYTQITKDDEERLQTVFDSLITKKASSNLLFDVKEVRCKIGNKLFSFPLAE